jgi:nucleotide-binding universal stress UspA family protein
LYVKKARKFGTQPVKAILEHLARHPADLVVLATHQRTGPERWIHRTMAEPIARGAGKMTLFVPRRLQGFVRADTGKLKLKRILIPCDVEPNPQRAVDVASAFADTLQAEDVTMTLLHVGEAYDFPSIKLPKGNVRKFETLIRPGNVVNQILKVARELSVDLIAMSTQGHKGFLDALRGTTTERILRNADCPTLMIPS